MSYFRFNFLSLEEDINKSFNKLRNLDKTIAIEIARDHNMELADLGSHMLGFYGKEQLDIRPYYFTSQKKAFEYMNKNCKLFGPALAIKTRKRNKEGKLEKVWLIAGLVLN